MTLIYLQKGVTHACPSYAMFVPVLPLLASSPRFPLEWGSIWHGACVAAAVTPGQFSQRAQIFAGRHFGEEGYK